MDFGEGAVGFKGTRVDGVILVWAELGRVHEDADGDLITRSCRCPNQGCVTGVQCAHGGHKANGVADAATLTGPLAEFGYGVQDLHSFFLYFLKFA
jgi:hypothetical protein